MAESPWTVSGAPRTAGRIAALLLVAACIVPPAANAQYFGRNKVQYESFDFEVLETEHFDIYYYEDGAEVVDEAGRMAERWYARISRLMDHQLRGRQPLILYTDHPDFEQTNALFGSIGEATGGATEALKRRIVLPLAGPLRDSDHVIGHELIHAFQYDMTTGPGGGIGFNGPTALALPLWFIEGMAEYLVTGPIDPHTSMWMRDAAACGCKLPSTRDLRSGAYFPYRWGQAFWAYVAAEHGDESIGKILKIAGRTGNPEAAIETVLQRPIDSVVSGWHQSIIETYAPYARDDVLLAQPQRYDPDPAAAGLPEGAVGADESPDQVAEGREDIDDDSREELAGQRLRDQNRSGRELVSKRTGSGTLNVGPSLSPDGTRLAYLSERSLFSIEMFIADATTGEVERKLTETATDPHFESLQFINSSGAWRSDGEAFAFATIIRGKPTITVIDTRDGDKLQEVRFEELGEIYTPTYSPDGSRLVFAAVTGGLTDVFLLDLATERLTRLTDDLYSDLQPAWSPDGTRIAFATDRFSTDLEELTYGDYQIAVVNVETREVQRLSLFDQGKHIDPHWGRDGSDLYFVSDASGISNVYRYDFAESRIYQVTDLYTGVSGITAISPSIAVSADGSHLVYTAYQLGQYDLYSINDPAELVGEPMGTMVASASPAVLPPGPRDPGLLNVMLEEPRLGLPDTITFSRRDYSPGLSLDYVSQPTVGAGVDRFGAVFAGGISMYFSDMLGNRNLSGVANINTAYGNLFRSSLLLAGYENRRTRWNWRLEGGQIPYVTRRIGSFITEEGFVEVEQLQWQTSRQFTAGVSYPFNRAFRWEADAGYQNIDFAFEERRFLYNFDGILIDEDSRDLESPESLNLAIGSTALVYDNTIFGGVGPILGQRYRVETSPRFGSLNYNNVLIDFRRYFRPIAPITFAGRALHFGRYGPDSEDFRLNELFLGYGTLIRGYNDSSFGFAECAADLALTNSCPAYDQLFGSRMALANLEMRVPLLGFFGIIPSAGIPPVEMALFFDAGTAWTRNVESELFGGSRDVVTSHGIAMRVNLLGLLVLEVDYVHPNNRPGKGWYWQFNFAPAF